MPFSLSKPFQCLTSCLHPEQQQPVAQASSNVDCMEPYVSGGVSMEADASALAHSLPPASSAIPSAEVLQTWCEEQGISEEDDQARQLVCKQIEEKQRRLSANDRLSLQLWAVTEDVFEHLTSLPPGLKLLHLSLQRLNRLVLPLDLQVNYLEIKKISNFKVATEKPVFNQLEIKDCENICVQDGTVVKEYLRIHDCRHVTLGNDMQIQFFDAKNTSFTKIPENMWIKYMTNLLKCAIDATEIDAKIYIDRYIAFYDGKKSDLNSNSLPEGAFMPRPLPEALNN